LNKIYDCEKLMGKPVISVLAAIAEFKRELIKEGVVAGMKEARRKGKHCDRPAKEFDVEKAAGLRKSGFSWRKLETVTGVPVHILRAWLGLSFAPGSSDRASTLAGPPSISSDAVYGPRPE
jgi:DNA invertase Pin-like site-specific DNA recombinase